MIMCQLTCDHPDCSARSPEVPHMYPLEVSEREAREEARRAGWGLSWDDIHLCPEHIRQPERAEH